MCGSSQTPPATTGGPFISPDQKWVIFRSDRKKPEWLQSMSSVLTAKTSSSSPTRKASTGDRIGIPQATAHLVGRRPLGSERPPQLRSLARHYQVVGESSILARRSALPISKAPTSSRLLTRRQTPHVDQHRTDDTAASSSSPISSCPNS